MKLFTKLKTAKMHTISQKATYWLSVSVVGLVIGLGIQVASAGWNQPTAAPPFQSIYGPVTTGAYQVKTGGLGLGGSLIALEEVVAGTRMRTPKLLLANKWLFSDTNNDDWLRLYNKDGTGYYGGFAAHNLWSDGGTWLNEVTASHIKTTYLGTNGYSGNPSDEVYPNNWGGGIHTLDVYAKGTIAAGYNRQANAWINSGGDIGAKHDIWAKHWIGSDGDISAGNNFWAGNWIGSGGNINATVDLGVGRDAFVGHSLSTPQLCLSGDCRSSWPSGGGGAAGPYIASGYGCGSCPYGYWESHLGGGSNPKIRHCKVKNINGALVNMDGYATFGDTCGVDLNGDHAGGFTETNFSYWTY